jgi:hypothetical protein
LLDKANVFSGGAFVAAPAGPAPFSSDELAQLDRLLALA